MIGQAVYARAGTNVCTLEENGVRVGVIISHQRGGVFSVRTKDHSVVDVQVDVPKPLLILEQRVSELDLPGPGKWAAEVNHQMAEEFGTRNIQLFLPHQVPVVRMNFMLDDYEMRLVSENGHEERFCTFATVLMAWKRAVDDNKR
jgi:hypothetical protein